MMQKVLSAAMLLSFFLAITAFINGAFSFLIKDMDAETTARIFAVAICATFAGSVFWLTIKHINKNKSGK